MTANDQWAVVELMGHVRTAGRISEEERFGGKLGRLDVPQTDGSYFTTYFGAASVYRITYVSEEAARAVAVNSTNAPVRAWEMPKALPAAAEPIDDAEWDADATEYATPQ